MKEAIIYGGAFNPPTNAHKAILRACVVEAEKNEAEVWVLPSGNRADKTINNSVQKRVELVNALIKSIGSFATTVNVELSELLADTPTQTYQTHAALTRQYPEHDQTWVFGADSIATMPSWEQGRVLWQNLSMLVVPRPGIELAEIPPNARELKVATIDVSSTLVRELLVRGDAVDALVPPEVAAVLQSVA